MKTYTNYAPGTRGITVNSDNGPYIHYLDPGQSVKLDPALVIATADLGEKPASRHDDAGDVATLQRQVADLEKQVEALGKERDGLAQNKADLEKQVEALRKPAKPA